MANVRALATGAHVRVSSSMGHVMRWFDEFHWSELALGTLLLAASAFIVRPAPAASAQEPAGWTATIERQAASVATPETDDHGGVRARLGRDDEIAVLEAMQFTLDEVGDGATYLWHRKVGPLRGFVRPTASFRDQAGRVCRHLVLGLSHGKSKRQIEGIACRGDARRWDVSN